MKVFFSLLVFFSFIFLSHSQNEELWLERQLFTHVNDPRTIIKETRYQEKEYRIDINNGGSKESIRIGKKLEKDFLELRDFGGRLLFRYDFQPKGPGSFLYKLRFSFVNKKTPIILAFYYTGEVGSRDTESKGLLYWFTFDDLSLTSAQVHKGPPFWHEVHQNNELYFQREYKVGILDKNSDGRKEILVKHNNIERIYFFDPDKRKWSKP